MQKFKIATIVGFITTGLAIISISVILVPAENRSEWFWYRIFWSEFLFLLNWAYFGGFFAIVFTNKSRGKSSGGIIPGVGIVIFFYSLLSLGLMLCHSWYPDFEFLNRLHFASQIFLTATTVILMVLIYYSFSLAETGTKSSKSAIKTPSQLGSMLFSEESEFIARINHIQNGFENQISIIRDGLKSLREKITYSIPEYGNLGKNSDYIDFVVAIENFCFDISKIKKMNVASDSEYIDMKNRADSLALKVDLIVEKLKRT